MAKRSSIYSKGFSSSPSVPLAAKITGGSPKERIATADKASAAGGASYKRALTAAGRITDIEADNKKKADAAWIPNKKHIEKHFGNGELTPYSGQGLPKDNDNPPDNVRPDVPELTKAHSKSGTSYPDGVKKGYQQAHTGVCTNCLGKVGEHRYTPKAMTKNPALRGSDPEDIIHPGRRAGVDRPATHDTKVVAASLKPAGFGSNAAQLVRAGLTGRQGGSGDKTNRNIEKIKKPKNESIFNELLNFLHEYRLVATASPVKKYEPKKHGELAPMRNTHPLPHGTSNAEREKEVTSVETTRDLWMKMRQPKKPGAEQFHALFKEEYMNPNKIANKIIREAFTSGDRNNTTPNNNDMYVRGGTQRQMLAGEMVGSVIWPFDQVSNPMYDKLADFEMGQAHNGLFGKTGSGSAMESVAVEIVDNLLEDSPSAILSDPDSVGYLINEMYEAGYIDFAATLKDICENAREEDVVKVSAIIEKLEADKADTFLIEQLTRFATQFLITEDDAAPASDENLPKDDAAEKTDDNKSSGEA
jgi:hypothetical protein